MNNTGNLINSLLSNGRLQEAEWMIRSQSNSTYYLQELSKLLRKSGKDANKFFITPGYYGNISSWELAESYCQDGYQANSVAEAYISASQNLIPETAIDAYTIRQLCSLQHIWLTLKRPRRLKVVDFGGALGHHFHKIAKHWHWCKLEWIVCETTRISSLGQEKYRTSDSKGSLSFTDNIEKAIDNETDIFFASSSIQYIKNWKNIFTLTNKVPWILLDRLPLIEGNNDLIVIQVTDSNYTDTRYQGWKFSKNQWLKFMSEQNLSIEMNWTVPEDSYKILDISSGSFKWGADCEFGYLFKRSFITSFM